MSLTTAFHTQVSDLAAALNTRHQKLDHAFAPYLAPRILLSEGFYGEDERRLLVDSRDFAINERSIANWPELLTELDKQARSLAISWCAAALLSAVEFKNGSKASPAGDGMARTDATGGLLVEHISRALGHFTYFSDEAALIMTSAERERLELVHRMEGEPAIHVESGKATHVLGAKIVVLNDRALPAKNGTRTCFALTKGALYFDINWSADGTDGWLTTTLAAVRTKGELVHQILTTAC